MSALKSFGHVIFTRFNLDTSGREEKFRNSHMWLDSRFQLFEKFCLPSIKSQTCENFTWCVLFSKKTPDWARKRIAENQESFPFHAYFTEMFGPNGWGEIATSFLDTQPTLLITTNLDSDDALSNDFVERIQFIVRSHDFNERYAINFLNGYVRSDKYIFEHAHPTNAFSTLVEFSENSLTTTCGIIHMDIKRYVNVIQELGPAAWMQVVHGNNVSNIVRGKRTNQFDCTRFPDEAGRDLIFEDNLALHFDRLFVSVLRDIRDLAFILFRRFFPAKS